MASQDKDPGDFSDTEFFLVLVIAGLVGAIFYKTVLQPMTVGSPSQ